ncbi:MAG TPA: succinylglutamate desuccinylase/aspartoacylase family protein [Patescibacteria group bacterium]|jgi:succinylglutamate desuccinylase|nr:succinylglutamate desuccinylase/aspartoacylase family protein [Patescibacteria group bacterium]
MEESIIEIKGEQNGPTSIILAGVHGNETCGIEAFEKILPTLKITKGKVIFAYGNPKAIKLKVRFTEANLNRMFKESSLLSATEKVSYEYGRAQELKTYFDQAENLLDIHASNTPKSKPFIICENSADTIAKYFPIELIVNGFDKLEPGGTEYYMNQNGKVGLGIECGYIKDPESLSIAIESIKAFLSAVGHLNTQPVKTNHSYLQMESIYLSKTDNFILEKEFDDFEQITQGQIIGRDGNDVISADSDGIILFARNRNKINDECFLLGNYK